MTDNTELKRLAEAATTGPWSMCGEADGSQGFEIIQDIWNEHGTHTGKDVVVYEWSDESDPLGVIHRADAEFIAAANPVAVLALIAENKRLAANVKLNLCDHPAIHQGDVDLLVAFVAGTSQMELAKVHGCTPPNISRKIRRVKERLGWREGMLVSEIRDRAEQLRTLASQGAVVTADLMSERDQLRAEVAGLKAGYEAYEQVNAELKAENEALRKDADRAAYWKQRAKSAEGHLFSGDFRAAAMELHKYSRFESTPWPELTGSQHALISSAAGAVIATVNRLRDARRPKNRDETDAIIWCACGDGHAANSYGAGFMDANNGVCANCGAALGQGEQS